MSRFEAGVTGSQRCSPEGKWVPGGGMEIQCTYKVYGRIEQKSYLQQHILIINPWAHIRVGLKVG